MGNRRSAQCACHAVEVQVTGEPVAMAYCYAEKVLSVRDGLPKYAGMPAADGAGEQLAVANAGASVTCSRRLILYPANQSTSNGQQLCKPTMPSRASRA